MASEPLKAQAPGDTAAIAKAVASRAIIDARELQPSPERLVLVDEGPFARTESWFLENAPVDLFFRRTTPPDCSRGIGEEAVGLAFTVRDVEFQGARAAVNVSFYCGGATQHMSTAVWSYVYHLEQVKGVWLPTAVEESVHGWGRVGM